MGFRSDVYIECEQKAYELFKEAWNKYNLKPETIEKTQDNLYKFSWEWIKWYEFYPDIDAMESIFNKLQSDNYDEADGYAFKAIWIHEDDTTEIKANASGEDVFDDFYVMVDVSDYFNTLDETLL